MRNDHECDRNIIRARKLCDIIRVVEYHVRALKKIDELICWEKSKSEVESNFWTRLREKLKLNTKLNQITILNYKLMIHDDRF